MNRSFSTPPGHTLTTSLPRRLLCSVLTSERTYTCNHCLATILLLTAFHQYLNPTSQQIYHASHRAEGQLQGRDDLDVRRRCVRAVAVVGKNNPDPPRYGLFGVSTLSDQRVLCDSDYVDCAHDSGQPDL